MRINKNKVSNQRITVSSLSLLSVISARYVFYAIWNIFHLDIFVKSYNLLMNALSYFVTMTTDHRPTFSTKLNFRKCAHNRIAKVNLFNQKNILAIFCVTAKTFLAHPHLCACNLKRVHALCLGFFLEFMKRKKKCSNFDCLACREIYYGDCCFLLFRDCYY